MKLDTDCSRVPSQHISFMGFELTRMGPKQQQQLRILTKSINRSISIGVIHPSDRNTKMDINLIGNGIKC